MCLTASYARKLHPTGYDLLICDSRGLRRLTPLECERLQGFPDYYTDIVFKRKPAPVKRRIAALGNSWPIPVIAWIGQRINKYEEDSWYEPETSEAQYEYAGVK